MPHSKATVTPASNPPLRYGLLLFPQFEVLDVFGPLEALNTLVRIQNFQHKDDVSLVILAKTLDPVSAGPIKEDPKPFNLKVAQSVVPTHTFENAPDVDVLLVPGGYGTGPHTASGFKPDVEAEIDYIRSTFPKLQYLITVCTGATLAAQAGALNDRAATTNKAAWNSITPTGPQTYWVGHARWVRSSDGKVWTTSGVSAGTDGFLAFLDRVYGNDSTGVPLIDQESIKFQMFRLVIGPDREWEDVHNRSKRTVISREADRWIEELARCGSWHAREGKSRAAGVLLSDIS